MLILAFFKTCGDGCEIEEVIFRELIALGSAMVTSEPGQIKQDQFVHNNFSHIFYNHPHAEGRQKGKEEWRTFHRFFEKLSQQSKIIHFQVQDTRSWHVQCVVQKEALLNKFPMYDFPGLNDSQDLQNMHRASCMVAEMPCLESCVTTYVYGKTAVGFSQMTKSQGCCIIEKDFYVQCHLQWMCNIQLCSQFPKMYIFMVINCISWVRYGCCIEFWFKRKENPVFCWPLRIRWRSPPLHKRNSLRRKHTFKIGRAGLATHTHTHTHTHTLNRVHMKPVQFYQTTDNEMADKHFCQKNFTMVNLRSRWEGKGEKS